MTEAPPRPGTASVSALVLSGAAVFVVPQLIRASGSEAGLATSGLLPNGSVAATPAILGVATAHILSAVVLLVLLTGRGVARYRAIAGSLLFLLHPVALPATHVEAFQRDTIAVLPMLLALYLTTGGGLAGRALATAVAFVLAVGAAVLSPVAVVLPLVAWFLGVSRGDRGARSLAVLFVGAVCGFALHVWLAPSRGALFAFDPAHATRAIASLVWPRTGDHWPSVAPTGWGITVPYLIFGALLLLALRLRKSYPGVSIGLAILVVAAQLGAVAPDVPSISGAYLATIGAAWLVAHLPVPRGATIALAATTAAVCLAVVLLQGRSYASGQSLFAAVAERRPEVATESLEHLARSPLDSQRRQARAFLTAVSADLPEGEARLRAQRLLVDVLAKLGDTEAASTTAETMCTLGEKLALPVERMLPLYIRTAECFSVENARKKIDEYFGKARKIAPDHPSVLAADAEQLYVDLVHAVRRESENPDIDVTPGWLEGDDARLPPIRAKVEAALAKDAACYRALILKGRMEEATGGVLSAVTLYRNAVEAGPKRVEARVLLATLYVANDLPGAAEECVKKALQEGLDDPALHYLLGNIYAVQGRREDARRYLEIYLRNRPGNRNAMVLLANLLSAQALAQADRLDVKQLAKFSQRIRTLNPEDPKGWMVEAAVLCKSRPRRFVEAIVLLEKAMEKMPGNPEVARRLACAHRDLGWMLSMKKRDLAMDHFKTFLEIAPKGVRTEAVRNAVRAHCKKLEMDGCEHLRTGESKVAEATFRRSAYLAPDRPEAFFQLGLAQMSQKKLDDSVHAFEEAIRLGRAQRHDISHYLLPLLDTLQKVGRAAEAKRRGEAFLADPGSSDSITVERIRKLLR